jgi:hypothetical protein
MTRTWLKAYRTAPAIAGTLLLCVVSLLTTQSTIRMGSGNPVRTTWFMLLGVVVLSSLPLYPSFGILEHTFARARMNRIGRAVVAAALVATAAAVVGAVAGTLAVVIWFILLAALSLLAAAATTDKSWAVVLLVGGGTIGFDHMMISSPISRVMDIVGLQSAFCAYAVAWLAFVLLPGPRDG